jgi:hypothetical protein
MLRRNKMKDVLRTLIQNTPYGHYNIVKHKLKAIQNLPTFNAIDIIKAFTNAGFEIVVDDDELTILNYKVV